MEIWDIYDRDRIKTGKIAKGDPISPGSYIMVVHLCIFNSEGKLLIQQRQSTKAGWPNMWDVTVAGRSISGDTSQKAVQRELLEELGLDMDFEDMKPYMTVNFAFGFDDIYLVEADVDLEDVVLQVEEVQAVRWATREEVLEMIDKGEFLPYFREYIDLWFYACGRDGFMNDDMDAQ